MNPVSFNITSAHVFELPIGFHIQGGVGYTDIWMSREVRLLVNEYKHLIMDDIKL